MSILTSDLECRLLDACIIAYDIKNGTIDPSVPYYDKVGIKPGTLKVFVDGLEQINAGYVAETTDDWVFLVFRGTLPPFKGDFWAWILDWLNDFRIGPMSWYVNGSYFGQVETGFGSALLDLWNNGMQKALSAIDLASKKGVIVSGHSKGGGMTFPAAALVKALYPQLLVENCSFAAPLTCDRTFRNNYDGLGLRPFTVRYQNQYDIVPFLPYFPYFGLLAAAERRARNGVNTVITSENWPAEVENDYVPVGILRYLGDGCRVEYGEQGQDNADKAIWDALEHLEFQKIVDAHGASGRYHTCICGVT